MLHNFRYTGKEDQGNTIFCRIFQGISFHTERKDRADTTSIWSYQRNCHCYNDALQKHKSNGLVTWWRYWLLQHSCWSLTKRYISTIFAYTLPRLHIWISIDLIKRWFHIKKSKKQTIPHRNYDRCRLSRWPSLLANPLTQTESILHHQ